MRETAYEISPGLVGSGRCIRDRYGYWCRGYGAMVAYLLIIKDTIPSILGVENRFEKILIMIATSATIMLPLSMQRDMASLSITSLFSVLADVVLVGFIVSYSPMS